MTSRRAVKALAAALDIDHGALRARPGNSKRDAIVTVTGSDLLVRWLPVGWPRQVEEALDSKRRPDVLAAPLMSPGAREALRKQGVGWVDESGAANIDLPTLRIRVDGNPRLPLDTRLRWRPAVLAASEAILAGAASPTVSSVVEATGISMGSAAEALKTLETEGHLTSKAARGPSSARQIVDRNDLLDAYAAQADRLRPPNTIPVGVLWRDPIAGVVSTGRLWDAAGIDWAATGALSASLLAPMQTEIAPMEIYVPARSWSDLRRAANVAGLQEITGGRLALRPFPTPAGAALSDEIARGFRSVLWPRVYADLRTTGVRGEDAAQHLREEMNK